MQTDYDVAIIGGALTGSSTAYHLLVREPGLRVCVIERDPSYEFAASARSNAGVRILFSQPENLEMSRYGHAFYAGFGDLMAIDGERPALDIYRHGYLFIANDAEQARDMELNHTFQITMECDVHLLDAEGVRERWPSLTADDIICAAYSPGDGWIDPHGALSGLRRKARSLGAAYMTGDVAGLDLENHRVTRVRLADGDTVAADWIVNATGAWARDICAMIGMTIPVEPLSRMVFFFQAQKQPEQLPFTRDGLGVGFRPEGNGFISGITNYDTAGSFCFDVQHAYFDEVVWPKLAHRVPLFESIRVQNAWAGHYAQNTFDGNMIIGPWVGHADNFLLATGYSGHGLQHTPAVGRALAELILDGGYQTIDLEPLSFQRVVDGKPYPERGVKA